MRRRAVACITLLVLAVAPARARAQHVHHTWPTSDTRHSDSTSARPMRTDSAMTDMPGMMADGPDMSGAMDGPLGIPLARLGSGTSWMPDSSPMRAIHAMWRDWAVMLHGAAFVQYDDQRSDRGDTQAGIINWGMVMATRQVGAARLSLHGMVSLEPLTIGARGYPLLLQTGESYQGEPLHDRQHPHDAIMELAALIDQPIGSALAVELYGGLAGEPALGPVAFMHRPSADDDPLAPLGHHWQDATHVSFGVVTAGIFSRSVKLEGSVFNGREPDENRWDLDLRRLDSYSGRLTVNATGRLSLAGWYGFLASPEALHPEESVHRFGASALYAGRGADGGTWSSALIWGANAHAGRVQNSVAAESNLELGRVNAVFGRAEYVRKSAEDLVLPGVDPDRQFDIASFVLGYTREVASAPGATIGIGGRATINVVPVEVGRFYGTRVPAGASIYLRIRTGTGAR